MSTARPHDAVPLKPAMPGGEPMPVREAQGRRRGGLISMLWLLFPAVSFVADGPTALEWVLVVPAYLAFVVLYGFLLLRLVGVAGRRQWAVLGAMATIAGALSLWQGTAFVMLWVFVGTSGGLGLRGARGGPHVVWGSAAAACACTLAVGGGSDAVITWTATTLGVGFMMVSFGQLIGANRELRTARAELAHLAVAEERLRFSRDLHDLVGHSLSVIALKAELSGRLLPSRADDAQVHVQEIETVARAALAEVREAVSGYRKPTLAGEVAGARMALSAAGIEADVDVPDSSLPEETEAVLAWTVREGVTNVLRHSGARHVRIAVVPGLSAAAAEISDDGSGPDGDGAGRPGNGLAGLRERAERLGGSVESGPGADAGFVLRVSVPTASAGAPAPDAGPMGVGEARP